MMSMRLRFNPIIPLLRGFFAIFCSAFAILLIWAFFIIVNYKGFSADLIFHILGHILFVYFTYLLIRALLSQTRNYSISTAYITQRNYLDDVEKQIKKRDVTGFQPEKAYLHKLQFRRITIYLSNGKKIRFKQFEFFNFEKIEPALVAYGYRKI